MVFNGFEKKDFDTFFIDGLESRMEAIQTRIQPKFQEIGSFLADYLATQVGNEVFVHIAKHARRTVNPPKDTWLAIAANKRGYKKHPHFQVGLFDDHVFIWLALIYELDHKSAIAQTFINSFDELKQLPKNFVVSLDHMKKDAKSIEDLELKDVKRFRDVKKAEFLVGLHLDRNDDRVYDGDAFLHQATSTIDSLLPFYKKAVNSK
ncbi:MAG: YktB family protein [Bacillota bacterium]|uniref:UPF0637 protein KCX74_18930 n=1 Tax=Virgibacillus salarius TaxID=447199 RepID=A0A941E3D6_9BACI|nr:MULTISPECIES: DUF1054 domain-containing protein [Virgibacillus]NAZ10807.1 DUF1054 family protein [Agaribacter marinus]MBR7798098.1 DUF1054 domain-containing protein [Virgibacillus salarius]MCC2249650.1 DUF1054 domain-containing protein [Virgibacillus sp. AGTR]MDY7044231.1 DUF1054 domain-containing protein [Virgibacillus sp. M23]QRZ16829.1 DUF1054 domain-containing protein [Virgibacillus sp. AGTR]